MRRIISLVTLLSFLFCSTVFGGSPAPAKNSGVFLDYTTSRNLVADLNYYKQTSTDLGKKLNIDTQYIATCDQEVANLKQENTLKTTDLASLDKAKGQYEKLYQDQSAALIKAQQASPSRFTWFSIGGITTAVLFIAAFFVIKK